EADASQSLADALGTRGFEALVPDLDQEIALEPRKAGQTIIEAIAEAKAAPMPEQIAETEAPADPSGAAAAQDKAPEDVPAEKTAPASAQAPTPAQLKEAKEQKHTAEKKARRVSRRTVTQLENINDQMRDVYERATSGEIDAQTQPLLDAVAVLLEQVLARTGKER
ncbi:MAG: MBL fold metallo-hydrolase, partial [Pyramidobacter sp.]|nr:MBL fold metallo-hydrolase [Pyramidobacter sp.]